jgi:hypothetical protein
VKREKREEKRVKKSKVRDFRKGKEAYSSQQKHFDHTAISFLVLFQGLVHN